MTREARGDSGFGDDLWLAHSVGLIANFAKAHVREHHG
jgi:hypothetical protein